MPLSLYYKADPKEIASILDKNTAHRYLASLIVNNEQNKSNLIDISEKGSSHEYSVEIKISG